MIAEVEQCAVCRGGVAKKPLVNRDRRQGSGISKALRKIHLKDIAGTDVIDDAANGVAVSLSIKCTRDEPGRIDRNIRCEIDAAVTDLREMKQRRQPFINR